MTKLDNHYNLFINGEWRQGSKGQVMLSDNPANNSPGPPLIAQVKKI